MRAFFAGKQIPVNSRMRFLGGLSRNGDHIGPLLRRYTCKKKVLSVDIVAGIRKLARAVMGPARVAHWTRLQQQLTELRAECATPVADRICSRVREIVPEYRWESKEAGVRAPAAVFGAP